MARWVRAAGTARPPIAGKTAATTGTFLPPSDCAAGAARSAFPYPHCRSFSGEDTPHPNPPSQGGGLFATFGPAPIMRIDSMSVRLDMGQVLLDAIKEISNDFDMFCNFFDASKHF